MKHLNGYYAGSELYRLGIDYHDYGTIKCGRKSVAQYFKTDKITEEQKQKLLQQFSNVDFSKVLANYAPEIQKVMIIFYTKAEIERNKNKRT